MFLTAVADVAIGIVFTFLALSLMVSALTETISSVLGLRASTLWQGVKALLNDPATGATAGLATRLYQHALINPLSPGATGATNPEVKALTAKPSYIDPGQFASAMIDILKVAPDGAALRANADALLANDPQLKAMLDGMLTRSGDDIAKLRTELATWFNGAMDRVSGVYKRYTQVVGFILALTIAGLLNIDVITEAQVLWKQPSLADAIKVGTGTGGTSNPDALAAYQSLVNARLPVGWPCAAPAAAGTAAATTAVCTPVVDLPPAPLQILGWLLAAFATLFGAPFWFDALQSFVRLKGSGDGPSPSKSAPKTTAA